MSLQFSRSLRSLRIDSYRAANIGLILAILNMSALVAWFFLARVTLYETSPTIRFTEDGRLVAGFAPEALKRIQPGQSAILRISMGPDQPTVSLPALVYGVDAEGEQVELLVMSSDMPDTIMQEKLTGQIEVEVEHITPAELVLRSSGKILKKNEIPLSPQSTKISE